MPSLVDLRMMPKICCTRMGASPSDGSSSRGAAGRDMSARPMASICCSPPDSVPPFWTARSRRRGNRAKTCVDVSRRRRRAVRVKPPIWRFSRTVRREKMRRPSGACPMPAPDESVGRRPRDVPALELDRSDPRMEQPADGLERRGLARAVRADERHDLALHGPRGRCPGGRGSCRSRCARRSAAAGCPGRPRPRPLAVRGGRSGGGLGRQALTSPAVPR